MKIFRRRFLLSCALCATYFAGYALSYYTANGIFPPQY
jgi:hypothetical protein